MKNKKVISVEIVGDFACPWCYIGLHELQKAAEALKDFLTIDFQWIPFEISPNVPVNGFDRARHLKFLFGSMERAAQIFHEIEKRAISLGLHIDFSLIEKSPNTFHLHRLAWKAGKEGQLQPTLETLFRSFFSEGIDMTSAASIADALENIGWRKKSTENFLQSREGVAEVIRAEQQQVAQGVRAVPRFIIDKVEYIDGAQFASTWRKLLSSYSYQQQHKTLTKQS